MTVDKEPNFVCDSCGVHGYKKPSQLKRSKNNFCGKECFNKFQNKKIEKKCDYCGEIFLKKISQTLVFEHHFCSNDCFAKFRDKRIEKKCDYENCESIVLLASWQFKKNKNNFCSIECRNKFQDKKEDVICIECGIEFKKVLSEIKRKPRHFCSEICRKNLNKHKDWGSSRSKLEIAIEEHFKVVFPFINIDYNKTETGYELDIFIPCLDLAIEINGIFHYKAIYGETRLLRTQQIDKDKLIKCEELDIKLIVINVSEDGQSERIQKQRISEVEQIVRDRIIELGYVFKSKQMMMDL